ncbi:Shikimate-5-dehydrogenase [Neofusicoccum parvum]|uniref:Shikimate-5-dehydrogenase n=1 Tax=Neofusicoccum parvum TaxID=310453 RepID=A0ACB5SHS5_9PEZI|nr:Shikimate-5-dehydrogenase [Neofusicoccum parvum]
MPASDREFYIFGRNISHSLSPALHNAGFRELGLPYRYSIHESEEVDQTVEELINAPSFGGASVTFPHKLQVGRLLSSLSPSAQRIGAVNTIVSTEYNGRKFLLGDNTDWSGIKACIVKSRVSDYQSSSALVVGAGGAARAACYALQTLQVPEIIVVNRTRSRAVEMAQHFANTKFRIFESLEELARSGEGDVRLIVACVPADDLTEEKIPRSLFSQKGSGVLIEMAYRPLETGMMKVVKGFPGWEVFRGTDVLEEQAYAQFELWTGERAPMSVMREAMQAEVASRL